MRYLTAIILINQSKINRKILFNFYSYINKLSKNTTTTTTPIQMAMNNINNQKNVNAKFHGAVAINDIVKVKQYIAEGADIKSKNHEDDSAVFVALFSGYYEIFQYLIQLYDIDINEIESDGMPLIFAACARNDVTTLKILIDNGANVKCENRNGSTPLFFCIQRKRELAFAYLLHLPQINVKECDKKTKLTPLQFACTHSNLEIVKLLGNHRDVQLNLKNCDGETAFFMACRRPDNVKIIKFLIARGCDINIKNLKNVAPIEEACFYDSHAIIKILLLQPQLNKNFTSKMLKRYLQFRLI